MMRRKRRQSVCRATSTGDDRACNDRPEPSAPVASEEVILSACGWCRGRKFTLEFEPRRSGYSILAECSNCHRKRRISLDKAHKAAARAKQQIKRESPDGPAPKAGAPRRRRRRPKRNRADSSSKADGQ
jgi:hypothetical protein